MWAAQAAVLGKADTAVRNKLSRFDLADRSLHKAPKLLTLLFRDRRSQILNFGSMLPDKDDQRHFRNPTDPRVADELRIERKQSLGLRRIATGCCLPVDQAVLAIHLPEGIEIGNEFASSRQCPSILICRFFFGLRIRTRLSRENVSSKWTPWWKSRSRDSPLRNSKGASRYASHSLKSTAALSSSQK